MWELYENFSLVACRKGAFLAPLFLATGKKVHCSTSWQSLYSSTSSRHIPSTSDGAEVTIFETERCDIFSASD